MKQFPEVRPSPIVGVWYSADPKVLGRQVDQYIHSATLPPLAGEVVALVAPHAGHRYSGRTAGHAFAAVQGQSFDLVVVVSPYHAYTPEPLLTSAHAAYASPLGEIPVDREAVAAVNRALKDGPPGLALQPVVADHEHSLEIELPFLQRTLAAEFKLLPVMVHTLSAAVAIALGKAIAAAIAGRSALLVASTDLSHFYPVAQAQSLDHYMLAQIASLSPDAVINAETSGRGLACGAYAVAAVLQAAQERGANQAQILFYNTSGDETGDFGAVVGYGAVAILRSE